MWFQPLFPEINRSVVFHANYNKTQPQFNSWRPC
uniref:Uncharacterized protein n=1 Tax=Anguilla anguilla TaxID=7936 RepID=A0A0E9VGU2_ANGAN